MIKFTGENHPNQISDLVQFDRSYVGSKVPSLRFALGEEFGDGKSPLVDLDRISDSDKVLAGALKDSYFPPKVLLRESSRALLHLPMKGVLEFTRTDGKTNCDYREYPYQHLHLRNSTEVKEAEGFRYQVLELYKKVSGKETDRIPCSWVIDAGWWIAQQTGTMFTLTNQTRSGDPYWAIYDHYGPYYPLPVLFDEDGVVGENAEVLLRHRPFIEFGLIQETRNANEQQVFRSPTDDEIKAVLFPGLDPKCIIMI